MAKGGKPHAGSSWHADRKACPDDVDASKPTRSRPGEPTRLRTGELMSSRAGKPTRSRTDDSLRARPEAGLSGFYTVHELAELAGVSVRTLHHYDELGLVPACRAENGYRTYDGRSVERLHQVLLFRETGMTLSAIKRMMDDDAYDEQAALSDQLARLRVERDRVDAMIRNVERTLSSMKGEDRMSDEEKFAAFKRDLVKKNEESYGAEARGKWGDDAVDASNARLMGMTEEQWNRVRGTEERVRELLLAAMDKGDVTCAEAHEAARLHGEWLSAFWKPGTYSKQAHVVLAEGYVADERFRAYYDKWAPGATEFLRDAICAYAAK